MDKKEVKVHEKKMHGAKGYAKGGVTSAAAKQYGRNLARAMNQKTSSAPRGK